MQTASHGMSTKRMVKIASLCFATSSMLPLLFAAVFAADKQPQEETTKKANLVMNILTGWTMIGWMIALGWAASEGVDGIHPTLRSPSEPVLESR